MRSMKICKFLQIFKVNHVKEDEVGGTLSINAKGRDLLREVYVDNARMM
jgi:hypothetical protein